LNPSVSILLTPYFTPFRKTDFIL